MPGYVARSTALAAVSLVGLSGCAGGSQSHASVSAAELQKTIVAKLAEAGTPSTWVNCGKDLPARVGATTRCDVIFNQADAVTAILTTTQVQRDDVTWEITGPEMTQDQVTRRVAGAWSAEAVTCNSGLDGNIGDWAQCEVTKDGLTMTQTLEVKAVRGLSFDITPTVSLPKQAAEDLLRSRLAAKFGKPFESATCPGDLVGVGGAAMDCAATTDGHEQTYTLLVIDTGNGTIGFDVGDRAAPVEAAPEPLRVEAAPEPATVQAAPAPEPIQAAPQPAPVQAAPVTKPVPPVEGVPHLPSVVPHLPLGINVPPPGPVAIQAGEGQMVTQAAGG